MSYRYQNGDRPLDGYTIQYALGRGGFGEVYFAVSDSGREVALKAVQNYEEVELRGISHCMNLKSPHLVMIFDVKRATDGLPWVIMEYVNGPSLRDILDESPKGLDIDQVRFFMRELCKGLSYLHEAGVVHRDLKPHNVFFEDGIVKIGDYSLSKVITNSHRSGNTMTVGSVHYMAPEISMGRYDKTVDIYALGCMLYEMITGEPPHVGESMGEVLMKHLSQDPKLESLPEPFATAVAKAMQREPSERFASAHEFAVAIQEASEVPSMDSFHPASLSMAGQRTKAARQQASSPAAGSPAASSNLPPAIPQSTLLQSNPGTPGDGLSGSTTPTMRGDTGNVAKPPQEKSQPEPQRREAQKSAPYVFPTPRRSLAERVGLHFKPSQLPLSENDRLKPGVNIVLLLLVSIIGGITVPTLGMRSSPEIPLRCWLAMAAGGLGYLLSHSRMMEGSGRIWSLFSRFVFLIVASCAASTYLNFVHVGSDREVAVFLSMLCGAIIPDWRCFLNPARRRLFLIGPTMFAGACSGVIGFFLFDPVSGATAGTTMLFALAMQATAPFRRPQRLRTHNVAEPEKNVAPEPPTQSKPKLAFDKTSIFLEALFLGAMVLVIAFLIEGDDELLAASVPVGLGGVYALYLRLQRRVAVDGSVMPMGATVFLDLLVVASAGLFSAMLFQFDDDFIPGIIIFGAATLWLGRLRIMKHRQKSLHGGYPPKIDKVSAFFELVAIACILTAVSLTPWMERYSEYVIGGISCLAGAVIAIRIRMSRSLFRSSKREGA